MMKTIFFGTNNMHKLREIMEIVGDQYQIKSIRDLEEVIDVEETEPTLEGNAALKADGFFAHVNMPCFADDTGLEVEALDGRPGVYSARYAGEHCSYQDNVKKLLMEMDGKENRKAVFRTVVAYYDGKEMRYFEGATEGIIGTEQRGGNGFGYDPVFIPEGGEKTYAEMTPDEKNAISHRARAVRAFADFLKQQA